MTKQEEIREGLYRIIIKQDYSPLEQFDWEWDLVGKLVQYLHSKDVVFKVNKCLPEIPRKDIIHIILERDRQILKAGYTATESLIKEEK